MQTQQNIRFPDSFETTASPPNFQVIQHQEGSILLLKENPLGEEGNSQVFEGRRYTLNNNTYQIINTALAVKRLETSSSVDREFKMMKTALGVEKCFEIKGEQGLIYLGMPLFGQNLFSRIKENEQVEINTRYKILSFFFTELARLHEKGIIHGDLKLENIVFKTREGEENQEEKAHSPSNPNEVAIIDFGFSHELKNQATEAEESGHTPGYAPPELFLKKISKASDIFSATLVVIYLLGLQVKNNNERVENIDEKHYAKAYLSEHRKFLSLLPFTWREDNTLNKKINAFLKRMQSQNPTERPSAKACADFFKGLSDPENKEEPENNEGQNTWRPVFYEKWSKLDENKQEQCNQIIKKIKQFDQIFQLHFMEYYIDKIADADINSPQISIDIKEDFREGQITKREFFKDQKKNFDNNFSKPTNLEKRAFLYACEKSTTIAKREEKNHDALHLHCEVATKTFLSVSALSLSTYLVYPAIIGLLVTNPIGAIICGATILTIAAHLSHQASKGISFKTHSETLCADKRQELENYSKKPNFLAAT